MRVQLSMKAPICGGRFLTRIPATDKRALLFTTNGNLPEHKDRRAPFRLEALMGCQPNVLGHENQ